VRLPLLVSKVAQAGLLAIENVRRSPSASADVGVNEYATPCATEVAGVPLIVGARLAAGGSVTVMLNAGRVTVALPSVTAMTMPLATPAALGEPESVPVDALKVAQVGLLEMPYASASLSASLPAGVNEYADPRSIVVGGVPVIVGGVLAGGVGAGFVGGVGAGGVGAGGVGAGGVGAGGVGAGGVGAGGVGAGGVGAGGVGAGGVGAGSVGGVGAGGVGVGLGDGVVGCGDGLLVGAALNSFSVVPTSSKQALSANVLTTNKKMTLSFSMCCAPRFPKRAIS
jgi:hypothetical protein